MTEQSVDVVQLINSLEDKSKAISEGPHIDDIFSHLTSNLKEFDEGKWEEVLPYNKSGIYFFSIKVKGVNRLEDLDSFGSKWGKIKGPDLPDYTSRYYPKRAKCHEALFANVVDSPDIPFYLGKSKDIQSRIREHVEGTSNGTYSLRLKHQVSRISDDFDITIKLSYFEIAVKDSCYYALSLVEEALRNRLNPVVGKQ